MSKHTPGPWVYKLVDSEDKCIEKEYEYIGPIMGSGQIDVSSVFCSKADADLVSAAPDILESLEWALTQNLLPPGVELDAAVFACMKARGKIK